MGLWLIRVASFRRTLLGAWGNFCVVAVGSGFGVLVASVICVALRLLSWMYISCASSCIEAIVHVLVLPVDLCKID